MVREILFRGKTVREAWVHGLLAHVGNAWYISNSAGVSTAYEVIPSTIGQYTCLPDKNDKKIFEGDIINAKYVDNSNYTTGVVNFTSGCFCVKDDEINNPAIDLLFDYEVIGNIHDNPELLWVKHESD